MLTMLTVVRTKSTRMLKAKKGLTQRLAANPTNCEIV